MLPKMCDGCGKRGNWTVTGWTCTVYPDPVILSKHQYREGCPFNLEVVEVKKFVRVGQQKQQKGWK